MTGQEFSRIFNLRSDLAYSGFLDNPKMNRLLRSALFYSTDAKYLALIDQKTFDESSPLLVSGSTYSVNNNRIFTSPIPIFGIASLVGTYTVTTGLEHNLIQGDVVTFSNIQGGASVLNGLSLTVNSIVSSTVFVVQTGALTTTATPNTGTFVFPKLIEDYMHVEAMRCKFSESVNQRIIATSGSSPMSIRFGARTQIRSGMQIVLSGMSNANYNGTWYAKQINNTVYDLYLNPDLTIPTTGGSVTNGVQGATQILWYEYAKPLIMDRQIDPYEQATHDLPKYESTGKFFKLYPINRTCSEITIDYLRIPSIFIDVSDNSLDLTMYYPEKYLYWICDTAIKMMATSWRDGLLKEGITEELIVNR